MLLHTICEDWKANANSKKGRLVLPLFRISHLLAEKGRSRNPLWKLGIVFRIFYLVGIVWILGIELHDEVVAGPGLTIYHGQGLVVNSAVVIGSHCVLRQNTTIGWKDNPDGANSRAPVLGNDVVVGAHVVIVGPIRVGNRAQIGAGAVVLKDVPDGAVVVGNPGRILKYLPGFEPAMDD